MEFNRSESETKPASILALLRKQVESQSNLCDFTIKMGTWSKRFHSCVLVGAEFFHHLLDSEFQEKRRGLVEMSVGGCPTNLEAAIMFLYGVCPHITKENIAHLFDLAEFLFIPNLKSLLVDWLHRETVTQDNYIQFLHIASLYDFDHTNCVEYIRANLKTCFENRDFDSLTKESVIALLSDDTLRYVGSDSKFQFVLDWLRSRGPAWSDVGRELIQLIDMEEVSADLIAEAQDDPVFQRCNIPIISNSRGRNLRRNVLLMKLDGYDTVFLVYDLERFLWFRLTPEHIFVGRLNKDQSSTNAVVYTGFNEITILDFDLGRTTETTLVSEKGRGELFHNENCYNNGIVWSTLDAHIPVPIGSQSHYNQLAERIELEAALGIPHDGVYAFENLIMTRNTAKAVVTLYKGVVNTDGGESKMTPVLAFPFLLQVPICINESNSIACVRKHSSEVYIFDANSFTLHLLKVQPYGFCELRPTRSGFVIYDDTRVTDISRQIGPAGSSRYIVSEIMLKSAEDIRHDHYCYWYVENMWIRSFSGNEKDWVSHDALRVCTSIKELTWTSIAPLHERFPDDIVMRNAVKVSLPQSKLICHVDCPHCERLQGERKSDQYQPYPNTLALSYQDLALFLVDDDGDNDTDTDNDTDMDANYDPSDASYDYSD